MTGVVFLLALFWGLSSVKASEGVSYGAGKDFASRNQASTPQNAVQVPGYQGTNVPEAGLIHGTIQGAVSQKLQDPLNARAFITETHDQRLRFDIDPSRDPIFTESDKVVNNPLAVLNAQESETIDPVTETRTRHTCMQEGEPYTLTCTRDLVVTLPLKTKTYAYTHVFGKQFRREGRNYGKVVPQTRAPHRYKHDQVYNYKQTTFIPDMHIPYFDGCNHYPHTVKNYYKYAKKVGNRPPVTITEAEYLSQTVKPEDVLETWTSTCALLEEKIDAGLCRYVKKTCSQGSQTRLINGANVTRPCWQETLTYQCSYPVKNTCHALKAKGCVQIGSQCAQKIGNTCVQYTQTYECTERRGGGKRTTVSGNVPWCLEGSCATQGFAPNKDMAEALSRLMIFREIQKDMDVKAVSVFKGEAYGCNRNCVDFKDCCGSGKGWGVSLGLAGCSEKEKALAQFRQDKKCVFVGTTCAEKVLGVCVLKKSTFCCFGTKLARVIHEQGRPQLRLNFGTAEHPQCRGLTVEELARLDFSKIDLSEILEEAFSKFKAPNVSKLSQDFRQDWNHRLPTLQQKDKPYTQKLKENAAQKGGSHDVVF